MPMLLEMQVPIIIGITILADTVALERVIFIIDTLSTTTNTIRIGLKFSIRPNNPNAIQFATPESYRTIPSDTPERTRMILLHDIDFSISLYLIVLTPGKKNSIEVKAIGNAIGRSIPSSFFNCAEKIHVSTVTIKIINVTISSLLSFG